MLTVTNKNFDWKNIPLGDCLRGNALDTHFTLKIFDVLKEKLEDEGCWEVMETLLSPVLPIFSKMEFCGLDVDPSKLDSVGKTLDHKSMLLEDNLLLNKNTFKGANLASTKDLREILYTNEEGLGLYPPLSTPKGEPSTSKPAIDILLDFINEELVSRAKK
jgi:DNA polymerase I-like protein with 3'-5' exonuclease and polymerase domains